MDFDLTPDQRDLQERARKLAGAIAARAAEIDRTEEYPWDNVELLKEAGFFGMTIPPHMAGRAELPRCGPRHRRDGESAAASPARIVVEANMGAIGAIMEYGTEAQKRLAADAGAGRRQAGDLHHRARAPAAPPAR